MPPLSDLNDRLATAGTEIRQRFEINLRSATPIADKVPLVHVIRGTDLLRFLSQTPCEIPTSDSGYCHDGTRAAEDEFGLGRCVYFYAGKAHPDFGNVAMAFSPDCEASHKNGSATPFDTGGLWHSFITPNLCSGISKEFCRQALISLSDWRAELARFLAAYFSPLVDYWTGLRVADFHDPEDIFVYGAGDWRRWVFEVRFHEGHSLLAHKLCWTRTRSATDLLHQEMRNERAAGSVISTIESFLSQGETIDFELEDEVYEGMNRWIQQHLGL